MTTVMMLRLLHLDRTIWGCTPIMPDSDRFLLCQIQQSLSSLLDIDALVTTIFEQHLNSTWLALQQTISIHWLVPATDHLLRCFIA